MALLNSDFALPTAARPPLTCRDGSRPSILLAEDSPPARILTAALLNRMGCDVDSVEHGEEALEFANRNRYDLIILDIEMPVMDGITAATLIKTACDSNINSPIIALSAFLADVRQSANWTGAFNAALSKPAGRDDLRDAIHAILIHDELAATPTKSVEMNDAPELFDDDMLEEVRLSLPLAAWHELLETTKIEFTDLSQIIANSDQTKQRDEIRSAAHRLLGITGSLGANKLQYLARRLEQMALQNTNNDLSLLIKRLTTCSNETTAHLEELITSY